MTTEPRPLEVQCITPEGLHRVAYLEWGDPDNDRVLVCVHGLTRVSRDFDALARVMCDHYRVVCVDVVGRGRSGWLKNPLRYLVPTYVADMVTLLARINASTVHWFGTSMGGLIGMGLASLPDTPISRLILNDVGPVLTGESLQRIAQYVGQPISWESFDDAVNYVRAISASFGPHSEEQWRFLAEVVLRQRDGRWVLHYDPQVAAPFREEFKAGKAPTDVELWPIYDAIRCPTLAIRGELSDLLTVATHRAMAERGPRAELTTIAGVGHAPTFLNPDQIAIARNFLLRAH
jgi:pimeloyl-ACP methyl ester carboxylesterase